MASAPSVSRSSAAGAGQTSTRPAVDVTALTVHDDFLLELGQVLGGRASVRPVDSVEAAVEALRTGRRGQLLVIDTRGLRDVKAAVDAAHAACTRAVTLVFAEGAAERQLAAILKGSRVFVVLPLPIDPRKTQAVLDGALAEAVAKDSAAPAAAATPLSLGTFRPQAAAAADTPAGGSRRWLLMTMLAAAALAAAAGGGWWYLYGRGTAAAPAPAPAAPQTRGTPAAAPAGTTATEKQDSAELVATPAVDTSIIHGKVDELLEKARLAMHERRFTEPAGDNALVYYRSAAAADASNAEAHDGLQRVAGVLAGRFEEALTAGRFDEAAGTLANFKTAAPGDARGASLEQRFYSIAIAKALADGSVERAGAYLRQAQQAGTVPAGEISRWRSDIARRQEEVKLQRLAGLVNDRIRGGRLTETDDSAKSYWQQLQAAAPTNSNTQRVTHELMSAYFEKAREAGLAHKTAEEQRWLDEARALGAKPADIASFQQELTGARRKADQAENERRSQLARERLADGRLTEPAQDSAAYYLTQLRTADAGSAGVASLGHEFAAKLLERARASATAGKPFDADLALAKQWGADDKDVLAVQQLQSSKQTSAASDPAALAASLKRTRDVAPDYPPKAFNQHVSGAVTVTFTVTTRGETRDVHVIDATPPGVFDQAAVNAVRHWRYAPMIVDGTAIEVPVTLRVRFELPK